jgi:hypothetical protein
MDKSTRTLDDILSQARTERPVMTREESRILLTSAQTELTRDTTPSTKWRWIMIIGVFLTAGVAITTWTSTTVHETPSVQRMKSPARNKMSGNTANSGTSYGIMRNAPDKEEKLLPIMAINASATSTIVMNEQRQQSGFASTKRVDVSGVRIIELPVGILDSLSIRVTGDGRILYNPISEGLDSSIVFQLPKSQLPIVVANDDAPYRSYSSLHQNLRIRMITDSRGEQQARWAYAKSDKQPDYSDVLLFQRLQDTAALSPQEIRELLQKVDSARKAKEPEIARLYDINRLIPLKVSTSDTSYYIFWYDPTAELLDLLSSRTLAQLRLETIASEMALYDKDEEASIRMTDLRQLHTLLDSLITRRIAHGENIQQSSDALPGTSIMEMSRLSDGALSLYSISPNPNKGEFSVRFAVRETRVIDFSVYDIHGNQLQAATSGVRVATEESESVIRLKRDLPPGIYLLVLSSNKGERAVQRLIIDR